MYNSYLKLKKKSMIFIFTGNKGCIKICRPLATSLIVSWVELEYQAIVNTHLSLQLDYYPPEQSYQRW